MRVRIDLWSKTEAGDKRHAQDIMADLGIKYQEAEPQPLLDQWMFRGVDESTIPDELPDYVEVFKDD